MTLIGKILVFLNLIIGVGVAVASTAVFTHRPGWFDAPDKAGSAAAAEGFTFTQMKAETETHGRSAVAASRAWGDNVTDLLEKERVRDDRKVKLDARLERARKGPKGKPAFFEQVRDPETKRVVVEREGKMIVGIDGAPLPGADTIADDARALIQDRPNGIAAIVDEIAALKVQWKDKLAEADLLEAQRLKQVEIREGVRNELFFLRGFGVNWDEERETVLRRKRQLDTRLAPLMK